MDGQERDKGYQEDANEASRHCPSEYCLLFEAARAIEVHWAV